MTKRASKRRVGSRRIARPTATQVAATDAREDEALESVLSTDIVVDDVRDSRVALELARLFRDREALMPLLLIGAGVSSRVGLPTWTQLMSDLHEYTRTEKQRIAGDQQPHAAWQELPRSLKRNTNYLWRAEYYCRLLGNDRFEQFVASLFAQPRHFLEGDEADPCLDAIVRLPVTHVLTTNYDTCLDGTHRFLKEKRKQRLKPFEVINVDDLQSTQRLIETLRAPNGSRYYVHLHGRVDQRDSMVLTESSYRRRYLTDATWSRALYAIFSTRQLVCIGFSATDPDLTAVLRQIAALGAGVPHYAILGIGRGDDPKLERERLETMFGIRALLYRLNENSKDRHGNLQPVLTYLAGSTGSDAEPTTTRRTRPKPAASTIPALRDKQMINSRYRDDPRRGCFGERSRRDGLQLVGIVTPLEDDAEWFQIELTVERETVALDPKQRVDFYVHPSFSRGSYYVWPQNGVARLSLVAWGAFTVGSS